MGSFDFSSFQVVFYCSRLVFMVFQGYRFVFHGPKWVFKVLDWFFEVPGGLRVNHGSRLVAKLSNRVFIYLQKITCFVAP